MVAPPLPKEVIRAIIPLLPPKMAFVWVIVVIFLVVLPLRVVVSLDFLQGKCQLREQDVTRHEYNCTVSSNTSSVDLVSYVSSNGSPSIILSGAGLLNSTNTRLAIDVVAEDGVSRTTYTIWVHKTSTLSLGVEWNVAPPSLLPNPIFHLFLLLMLQLYWDAET
jgi:hypothetical protein